MTFIPDYRRACVLGYQLCAPLIINTVKFFQITLQVEVGICSSAFLGVLTYAHCQARTAGWGVVAGDALQWRLEKTER